MATSSAFSGCIRPIPVSADMMGLMESDEDGYKALHCMEAGSHNAIKASPAVLESGLEAKLSM